MKIRAFCLTLVLSSFLAVAAGVPPCPTDGSPLSPTGKSKLGVVKGKAQSLKEYVCKKEKHSFWLAGV